MNKSKIILRKDVAKKRKKLGNVKDLFDNIEDSMMYEFEMYMKNKKYNA